MTAPAQLASTKYYTEGPVINQKGELFFTTLTGGAICKADGAGGYSVWAKSPCPNGQIILKNKMHLVCDSYDGALYLFEEDGQLADKLVNKLCAGESIAVPNDLVEDADGGIYFTDSVRHTGKVAYLSPRGGEAIVAKNLDYPNGIILSNNGQQLFVAESYKNRILLFEILENGKLGRCDVFAELPKNPSNLNEGNLPDGIKMDSLGNLWVAHYGMGAVYKINNSGTITNTYNVEMPLTSNLFLQDNQFVVTGGYAEPGPGAVFCVTM